MSRYDDLRDAIAKMAIKRSADGHLIVRDETSGARDAWIFDLRALLLQPQWLNRYAEIFWEKYADKLPFQVAGMETAGIPLVSAIVMKSVERGTPVNGFYVRKSRKRYGLMQKIEGTVTSDPIVVVDDLINSGSSIDALASALDESTTHIRDAFVLIAFREDAQYSRFIARGMSLQHLFTLKDFGIPFLDSDTRKPNAHQLTELWHYKAPAPSFNVVLQKSAPIADGTNVYFGCDDGFFRAIDKKSGIVSWEFEIGRHPAGKAILSSPTLSEGRVFFGAYDGNVYCLDANTGLEAWRYEDAEWVGSSPAISPELGLVYIGLEYGLLGRRGGIAALSVETGALAWEFRTPEHTHGSPLYIANEKIVVVGSNDGVIYAHDALTGRLRWSFSTGSETKASLAYDLVRKIIVFGNLSGVIHGVSVDNGASVFALETGAGIYSTPLISKHMAYVASLDKCLYAIDVHAQKISWTFETSGRIFASPALYSGSLWIGSNDGRLYEIDPENGVERSRYQFSERIVNKICGDTDHLYVSTVANELYCMRMFKQR